MPSSKPITSAHRALCPDLFCITFIYRIDTISDDLLCSQIECENELMLECDLDLSCEQGGCCPSAKPACPAAAPKAAPCPCQSAPKAASCPCANSGAKSCQERQAAGGIAITSPDQVGSVLAKLHQASTGVPMPGSGIDTAAGEIARTAAIEAQNASKMEAAKAKLQAELKKAQDDANDEKKRAKEECQKREEEVKKKAEETENKFKADKQRIEDEARIARKQEDEAKVQAKQAVADAKRLGKSKE